MKKLILSLASAFASVAAFAELDYSNAYWVIKDGKMTDKVTYVPYSDLAAKIPDQMVDSTINGENAVAYKHLSKHYLDVRLRFDPEDKLDLSKNYVLVMEYMIPDAHADLKLLKEDGNKPLFILGYSQTEKSLDKINCTHSEAYSMIDAKWGVTGEWVTVNKYIYSAPSVTTLEGMIFSYAREYLDGDMEEFPFIKNLGFVSLKEGKPFYAENFDGFGLGEFYYEKNDISEEWPVGTANAPVSFIGGVTPVITAEYAEYADGEGISALTAFRDFQKDKDRDQDASGLMDDELLHALQVETNRDSIIFPGIQIPSGIKKFYSKMLIKKHKNEDDLWEDSEDYADYDLPILLRFDNGETIDLAKDTIKPYWTLFEAEVNVPGEAKSFDLVFKAGKAGYLVDEINFNANATNDVYQIGADAFDVIAYVDENGDIVVVNGDLVAVYNIDGRTASKNDKAVVIVVKNENGQLASKIMLRK